MVELWGGGSVGTGFMRYKRWICKDCPGMADEVAPLVFQLGTSPYGTLTSGLWNVAHGILDFLLKRLE